MLPSAMTSTLAAPCEYFEVIRKSRFLAKAAPVASADEAQAFIQTVSDPDATHNCWAWKVGSQYRFSDDGEPGGTAIDSIPSFGPAGEIYVIWEDYGAGGVSKIMFDVSTDGGVTWSTSFDGLYVPRESAASD